MEKQFVRGEQIAYAPNHVPRDAHGNPDLSHPDIEFGFVTSGPNYEGAYFCRFWHPRYPNELRTKSCSECAPAQNLVRYHSHTSAEVKAALEKYC